MSILLQVLSNADRYGIELSELAKTSPGTALAELLKLLAQKHGRVIILVDEYDGFSFDGVHGVYNPFSTLSFFKMGQFDNFWFESGSPSFSLGTSRCAKEKAWILFSTTQTKRCSLPWRTSSCTLSLKKATLIGIAVDRTARLVKAHRIVKA